MNLNSLILEYILCDLYFFFFNKKSRKVSGLKIDSANSLYLIRVIQFYLSVSPPNTERRDTQESLNGKVGKSRENRVFEGVLEGF